MTNFWHTMSGASPAVGLIACDLKEETYCRLTMEYAASLFNSAQRYHWSNLLVFIRPIPVLIAGWYLSQAPLFKGLL